jgi:RHH-type proline utilization regulon transcriptional repressor/proline dehydrogenase/delta 1-pyrroline-5-carboxylate dehydrogenase
VRLVKGAYWDTEIKRAQERGLAGYPVFTRKAMTDLNYVACARQLLSAAPAHLPAVRHPQCAHRRHHPRTGKRRGKRLRIPAPARHGRGELYAQACAKSARDIAHAAPTRRSAAHRDLLAYLVRRLLENGANSSFVALAADDATCRYRTAAAAAGRHRSGAQSNAAHHHAFPLPRDLYRPRARSTRRGVELGERVGARRACCKVSLPRPRSQRATPLIDGKSLAGSHAGHRQPDRMQRRSSVG